MKRSFSCPATLRAVALFTVLGAGAGRLPAGTYTWTGAGGHAWSNNASWQGNVAPPNDGTADLIFGSTGAGLPSISPAYSIDGLTFTTGARLYTFDGGPLTLGAGGFTQNAANLETFTNAQVILGAAQTWTLASGAGALNFNSGVNTNGEALTINAATLTGSGNTISGALTGSGTLTKAGAGTLTLVGTSAPTGGTTVNAGTLILNNGANAAVTVNNAAGLQVQTNTTIAGTSIAMSSSGVGVNGGTAVTLTNNGSLTNAGGITGGNGSFGFVGGNGGAAVTLANNGSLTNSGTLTGGNGGSGLGAGNGGAAVILANNGSLTNSGTLTGGNGANAAVGGTGGAAVTLSNGGFLTNSGTITGGSPGTNSQPGPDSSSGGGVLFGGAAGTLLNARGGSVSNGVVMGNFANAVTLQVGSTITGGLNMGTSSSSTLTLTDDGTGGSQTYSGAVGGITTFAGSLAKTGAGTWIIDQAFSYTGDTTVRAGTLSVSDPILLGAAGSSVNLFNGAALVFTNAAVATSRTYNLGTSTLSPASGGSILYQNATINNGILGAGEHFLATGTTLNDTRTTTGTALSQNSGTVTFNNVTLGGTSTFTQASGATLNSTGEFVAAPKSTQTINGTLNTVGADFSGALTIVGDGSVNESGSTTPLYLDGSAGTTVNAGGQLVAASGSTVELGGLLVNNGTQTGVLNVNLGGVARGTGSFDTVNVGSGGQFGNSGAVGGASGQVVRAAAALFSPFASASSHPATVGPRPLVGPQAATAPQTTNVANLSLGQGSTLDFNLQNTQEPAGTGYDLTNVSHQLTLSGGLTAGNQIVIRLIGLDGNGNNGPVASFDPTQSYAFTLVHTGSGISGYSPGEFAVNTASFDNNAQGGAFSVVQESNDLVLLFTPVPEPATWMLVGIGAAVGSVADLSAAAAGLTTRRSFLRRREDQLGGWTPVILRSNQPLPAGARGQPAPPGFFGDTVPVRSLLNAPCPGRGYG